MTRNSTFKTMLLALLMMLGVGTTWADEVPQPVYFNDFSSQDGLTVVGNGVFETDADARFGQIFHNDPNLTKAIRTNYLLLPADVLSHSAESQQMTIAFWVNVKNAADFWFSPIFSAYGMSPVENAAAGHQGNEGNWPMFILQSRGLMQLNNDGWCDFGVELNDNPVKNGENVDVNNENTFWLDDKGWHLYTVTLTTTKVAIYIDGEVFNSWTLNGTAGQQTSGFFTYGANYKHICLGGNQAWNWADADPAYGFDDFAVYDKALTADQIKQVMADKLTPTVTFDFTDPGISDHIGTSVSDATANIYNETFTVDDVTLQVTAGAAASKIYVDANRGQNLVTYKDYTTLTFRAPEGMAITGITFTAAGTSNINSMTASSGTIEGMTWTGNADGVRFSQGGTSWLANAMVTMTAKSGETAALPAISYTECADIAAFNQLPVGTYAKVTLNEAEVIGKSADGFSTVWIQDATGGAWMQYTSLNAQLNEQTKISGVLYTVKREASGNTQFKEAEDTPDSQLATTDITEYTLLEGTLAELNVAANKNRVVKITGASFEATSATAGKLTQGEVTIDVNNGTATANQQLHKITDAWTAGETTMENVTIVAILVGKSNTENQLLPISMEAVAVETADATFDFANNPENWPTSAALFDDNDGVVTELTVNDVTLTSIQNNEWNANLLYKADDADPVFRVAKENAFKLTAPEGKALVKIDVTMANGQAFDFSSDNGTVADNSWTGNATEVTFTTAANRSISKINVFLADENDETVKPAAAVEVADIASFNAVEDGTNVKLTLTDARVNGAMGGSYYVEDASGATVIKGIALTPGTKLNGYIVGVKSTDTAIDFVNDPAAAVEYQLTATDATTFEATEATLEGTVTAIDAAKTQANYGRLLTIENVTVSGNGQNKTLTDADGNTIKSRDYMGTLSAEFTWPEKAAKVTGVLVYYMTDWFLMPVSDEAVVASTTDGIRSVDVSSSNDTVIYNLQGVRQDGLRKGVNIVNGKKVVVR